MLVEGIKGNAFDFMFLKNKEPKRQVLLDKEYSLVSCRVQKHQKNPRRSILLFKKAIRVLYRFAFFASLVSCRLDVQIFPCIIIGRLTRDLPHVLKCTRLRALFRAGCFYSRRCGFIVTFFRRQRVLGNGNFWREATARMSTWEGDERGVF